VASPLRRERVAEQIRQELSEILREEVRDPRVGWVTLTRVLMSTDLNYAKVYVSIYGDEVTQRTGLVALERAARFIRSALGHRIRLRQTPELTFHLDTSIAHSQRIMDVLRETEIPPEEATPEEER